MPTPTTHLGLLKPGTSDPFVTGDIATNWQTLDNAPGLFICTSTSHPTWGANQAGMRIVETDTGLIWRWDGTQFLRQHGVGWLGGAVNNTNLSTTSTSTPAIGPSVTVTVPVGGRRILVVANSPAVTNNSTTNYPPTVGIQRDGVSIWTEDINSANYNSSKSNGYGGPWNMAFVDLPTAGSHTYRTTLLSTGGYTVTMYNPATIDVFEL